MKERYSIEKFYIEDPSVLIDNDTHQVILTLRDYCYDEIIFLENLLNEQDEIIKELEKYKSKYTDCLDKQLERENATHNCLLQSKTILDNLKQENQQLKQSQNRKALGVLEKMKNYFDDKCSEDLSDGWIITNRDVVKYIDNQITELKEKK